MFNILFFFCIFLLFGYILMLSNGAVSGSSKHQPTISTSSTEAEYIRQFKAVWVQLFLEKLGFGDLVQVPSTLYTDSNSTHSPPQDPTSQSKAKHMEIKYYWQHQQVERETLIFDDVSSKNKAADSL